MRPVGYYVHHEGAGHGALGAALSTVLRDRLVGMGSGGRPAGWRGRWIDLPRDDTAPVAPDPTRGGAWHWAPRRHPGFAARMGTIARWVAAEHPVALVSDVSCEVTALGALLGVPTAAVVLHGRRDDRPHRLAWDSADALVAPWPAAHAEPWSEPWRAKVTTLGLVSRFDHRPPPGRPAGREVLVLLPSGAHGVALAAVEAAARATAPGGWRWTVAGGDAGPGGEVRGVGRVEDPWPLLTRARVVVATCGAGSVADVACARRPAVLLPQDRPFDEQRAFAGHLDGVAPVVVADRWPDPERWPGLLDRAAGLDPSGWDALHDRGGARRLAALLTRPGEVWSETATMSGLLTR